MEVDKDPLKYHRKRRAFAMVKNKLEIEDENCLKFHDDWFLDMGWITSKSDPVYENITRGMLDPKGDIYFYVGKDFRLTEASEKEFFDHLKELVEKLNISLNTKIYGGMIRGEIGTQWPCKKYFGTVGDFI